MTWVSLLQNAEVCGKTHGKRAKATEIDRSFNITVKVVFVLAYTVTVNTFKETIDSLEETSIWDWTRP